MLGGLLTEVGKKTMPTDSFSLKSGSSAADRPCSRTPHSGESGGRRGLGGIGNVRAGAQQQSAEPGAYNTHGVNSRFKFLSRRSRAMMLHEFNWKREVLESKVPVLVDFWAS